MPSGGPVLSYAVTQGPGTQGQRYLQMIPRSPGAGWSPTEIVHGFLTASASFADGRKMAREYLTTDGNRGWTPTWTATVYGGNGPNVSAPVYPVGGRRDRAAITVTGQVQANLSQSGTYAVPSSASTTQGGIQSFTLRKVNGQWRISYAPNTLLITSVEFNADYQLRNLYFFDPADQNLVPDPVYVPLQATPADLMNGLVEDLIKPPGDWLSSGATKTAFPAGTKLIGDVMLDGGTAAVNLGGTAVRASTPVLEQLSAQLLRTLTGSGQGQSVVQSVELSLGGKLWIPPGAQENPVQNDSTYKAPLGSSGEFYYLDSTGWLLRRAGLAQPVKVAHIGTGYSAIAVSPQVRPGKQRYLAALKHGVVSVGAVGGRLTQRPGAGFTTMSWDVNGNLWVTGTGGIEVLNGNFSVGAPAAAPAPVSVYNSDNTLSSGPFTGLRVAPDGVRVAVIGQFDLRFGAIVSLSTQRPGKPGTMGIKFSPFDVSSPGGTAFKSVTWYGPDNVITLGQPGPMLTEYPVSGGASTTIPDQGDIQSITASAGSPLIAGASHGVLMTNASVSGSWAQLGKGLTPVYPG
jgi:hypothetical protein